MTVRADQGREDGGGFQSLTTKQCEVLGLLAENRTTKEIAARLQVSDSAVNQRIEPLRQRFGGITRAELARRYRDYLACRESEACKAFTGKSFQLPSMDSGAQVADRDGRPGRFEFRDSMTFEHGPPWHEPAREIVPRLLDGKHAVWVRGIAILLLLVLIIAALVLGLTAAQVLTETFGEDRPAHST
jgi:DNA-binding CsgD family transcriptional regulator